MFNDTDIVGIRVLVNGERVDVADLGFICDGDELLLVRESDILLESSGTANNAELGVDDVNSIPPECLEPLEVSNESVIEGISSQTLPSDWITLNVGGTRFVTCRSTIEMKVEKLPNMFNYEFCKIC